MAPHDPDAELRIGELWKVYQALQDKFESSFYRSEGYAGVNHEHPETEDPFTPAGILDEHETAMATTDTRRLIMGLPTRDRVQPTRPRMQSAGRSAGVAGATPGLRHLQRSASATDVAIIDKHAHEHV